MPDYRRMYDDKEHLYAYDLPPGKDVVVQIDRCTAGELMGEKGRKSKKPMLSFVGKDKKLALNKTNGKTIAKMYGKDTDEWAGKWITIYATTTEFGGETVDCIRVKPGIPSGKPAGSHRSGRNAKGDQLTDQIREEMARSEAVGSTNAADTSTMSTTSADGDADAAE